MSGKSHGCGFHCIKMKHIGVTIGGEEILKDVNLHIHCGELTAVIGRNGAGKSTLLKAILGEIPHTGKIIFTDLRDSHGVHAEKPGQPSLKLTVGYVPQSLHVEKNTPSSVYDLIAGYVTKAPVFLYRSKKIREKIRKQLAVFQAEALIDKAVCDLSGGELQRVLLALATMPIPKLLVLDEPAAGIDQNGIRTFYETLDRIKGEYDMAVILVSHDLEYVREYADRVILLDRTVVTQGTAEEVYAGRQYASVFGAPGEGGGK